MDEPQEPSHLSSTRQEIHVTLECTDHQTSAVTLIPAEQHDAQPNPAIVPGQEVISGELPIAIHEKTQDKIIKLPDSITSGDDPLSHLTESERRILQEQLDCPVSKVNYFMLYRYADTWDYFIIFISVICALAAGAATPLMMILFGQLASAFQQVSFNTISFQEFESKLVSDVLLLVYIGIAEFVTVWVSTAGFIYTGENITRRIRQEYLKAILRQNMAFFDHLGAGEITTRITSDTNLIQDGISQKVGLTLTAISTFVTAFIVAYVKFWKLALICTSSIVCLVLSMAVSYRFIIKFAKKTLSTYGMGGSLAEEVISSMRMATAFGNQDRLAQQYDSYLKMAEQYGIRMQITQAFMIGSIYAIIYLNYGLGFWQAAKFLVRRELGLNDVITILLATVSSSYSLGNVTPHSQAFTSAVAAAVKIYSTIDRQSPLDPTSNDGKVLDHVEGNIELRNVSHIYPSRPEVTVMQDISLLLPAGRTTAIVGPSGSGKSTIIGLIERFYNPVHGEVLLDGHDIKSMNLQWLRQHISLVGQEPTLFAASVYENIKHGLSNTPMEDEPEERLRERVENAARKANAHNFITSLPEGYETQVGERGFLLSGGQKQRIAIARAIVSDPKILLLDEATSALDTKSEEVVQSALNNASQGKTTLIIAHRLSTIKTAHNIVVMAGGKIAEQGTHDELLDKKGIYYRLVQAQRVTKGIDRGPLPDVEQVEDSEEEHEEHEKMKTTHVLSSKPSTEAAMKETPGKPQKYSTWTLIKFIASFNRPELRLMIIGVIFAVLAGCAQPSQAVVYSKAVDTLALPLDQHHKIKHDANLWALMLLVIGVAQFFLFGIQGVCFGICAERLIRRSRDKAFRTILRQDIAFFDENSTGALISHLSTESKHLAGISGAILGTILMVSTTLTASMVVSLAIGWKLSLVCISIMPVMLFCGFFRVAMLARFQARAQKAYEQSAAYGCEAASAIRTVASLSREKQVLAAYEADLRKQLREGVMPTLKSSLLYALSQVLIFFCTGLGFWFGGGLLGKHEYTIFQFFVCFTSVIYGSQAAGAIFSYAPDMGKAKNAAAEFKTLLDRKPAIDTWSEEGEIVESITGAVEFRDVHFRYPSRPAQHVLRGLNLTIKAKQYVALVGSSGCGKSTTIALLERFYDALSGQILIDGKDISSLNVNSYRTKIALVSQEPTVYQGTIRENVLLGTSRTDVTEEEIIKACEDANIYDFILSLPEGFETKVGGKGSMLSGGQKQRIAIARALIRRPTLLLLDEATSALDSESERVVQAALDKAAKNQSTLVIAHRLSTIKNADVIYVLDQGCVKESGTHEELLRLKGKYSELVSLQNLEKTG